MTEEEAQDFSHKMLYLGSSDIDNANTQLQPTLPAESNQKPQVIILLMSTGKLGPGQK